MVPETTLGSVPTKERERAFLQDCKPQTMKDRHRGLDSTVAQTVVPESDCLGSNSYLTTNTL